MEKTKHGAAFWTYGDKNSDAVSILIHGYRGTHHGLELIAKELAKKGQLVIVPDLPGFGEGPNLSNYFLSNYEEWLAQFIQDVTKQFKVKVKPNLLGHSFGSVITAAYASQKKNSRQIECLILLNPIPTAINHSKSTTDKAGDAYYWVGNKLPQPLAHKWFSAKTTTLIASEFMIKDRSKEKRQFINKEHLAHFNDFTSIKALTESYLASSNHGVKEYATRIDIPTLIIAGEKDDIAPLEKQIKLYQALPKGTINIIETSGHLTHYESPKLVANMIYDFLESIKSE